MTLLGQNQNLVHTTSNVVLAALKCMLGGRTVFYSAELIALSVLRILNTR